METEEYWFMSQRPIDIHRLRQACDALPLSIFQAQGTIVDTHGYTLSVSYRNRALSILPAPVGTKIANSNIVFLGVQVNPIELELALKPLKE